MLESVVEHNGTEFGTFGRHALQGAHAVRSDGDGRRGQEGLHHPGLVADLLPRRGLGDPLKVLGRAAVPAAEDADGAGAQEGFEAPGKVQDVRGFACAAELGVADDEGGKGTGLGCQKAEVVEEVAKGEDQRPEGGEWKEPRTNPGRAVARSAGAGGVGCRTGKLGWNVYLRVHGERLEGT